MDRRAALMVSTPKPLDRCGLHYAHLPIGAGGYAVPLSDGKRVDDRKQRSRKGYHVLVHQLCGGRERSPNYPLEMLLASGPMSTLP